VEKKGHLVRGDCGIQRNSFAIGIRDDNLLRLKQKASPDRVGGRFLEAKLWMMES
jgi:hypothetical protein